MLTYSTIPKSNIKIVERGKIDTTTTHIYDYSLSWICTGTSMKNGWVKLVSCAKTSLLREMMGH
jgi:hypothetical protein